MNDPSIALCSHNTVPGRCPSGLGISCSSSGLGSQQLSCSGGCKDLREQRVHLKHNVWQDSETVSAAADDPHAGESVDAPAGTLKQPRDQRSSLRWAMHNQTLQRAPYTGSCGSAVCPAISVPKCHGERVSSGADDPISGEVCLDCAFAQACNATQEHAARYKKVGGACEPSRDRAEGHTESLSTVGKEQSSETDGSPSASDRAAANIAACHGVQLSTVDGIRVSDVSIVADGPISGGEHADSKRPEPISKGSRQTEVGEELSDQSGAGSPHLMSSRNRSPFENGDTSC